VRNNTDENKNEKSQGLEVIGRVALWDRAVHVMKIISTSLFVNRQVDSYAESRAKVTVLWSELKTHPAKPY